MQNKRFIILTFVLATVALVVSALNYFTQVSSDDLLTASYVDEKLDTLRTSMSVDRQLELGRTLQNYPTIQEVFGVESHNELTLRITSIDTTWTDELHTEVANVDTTWEVVPLVELIGYVKPTLVVAKEEMASPQPETAKAVKKEPKLPSIFQ